MTTDVMPLEVFARYRTYAREKGYVDPGIPHIGKNYGTALRLVYCGIAGRQSGSFNREGANVECYQAEIEWTTTHLSKINSGSQFWSFLDDVTGIAFGSTKSAIERRDLVACTNVSKLTVADKGSSPPDSDKTLRDMDAHQLRREISILKPDLLLCVSGTKLIPTAKAVFEDFRTHEMKSAIKDTWIRTLPTGGILYWTFHPAAWNANTWKDVALRELASIFSST